MPLMTVEFILPIMEFIQELPDSFGSSPDSFKYKIDALLSFLHVKV